MHGGIWRRAELRRKSQLSGLQHVTRIMCVKVFGLQQVNSHKMEAALIVAVKREFSGRLVPLELESFVQISYVSLFQEQMKKL